jgi:hypothetical protein
MGEPETSPGGRRRDEEAGMGFKLDPSSAGGGSRETPGTVRNLVCGAIVTPTEGAYGDQERHPGPASGRP